MNLSRAWFLYISPFSFYLTPTHTLLLQNVSLCEGEDRESRSVPSRSEDARRRTGSFWAPALKRIATRFRCAMNWSLGSSPGTWGAPNKGNADGAVGIFGNFGRVWATALRPDPPKKALCHTCPLGGACNKYRNESVEIGPGMLDYLLRSAPTDRERILTSKKS